MVVKESDCMEAGGGIGLFEVFSEVKAGENISIHTLMKCYLYTCYLTLVERIQHHNMSIQSKLYDVLGAYIICLCVCVYR